MIQYHEYDLIFPILLALLIVLVLIIIVGSLYRRNVFITDEDLIRSMIEGEIMTLRASLRLKDKTTNPEIQSLAISTITNTEENIRHLRNYILPTKGG